MLLRLFLVLVIKHVSGRQVVAFLSMLYPKLILSENIYSTKLASLPVKSELLFAHISPNMFANLCKLIGSSTSFTLRKFMRILALLKKMISKFSNIDTPTTLITKYKHLTVIKQMLLFIIKRLSTIFTNSWIFSIIINLNIFILIF